MKQAYVDSSVWITMAEGIAQYQEIVRHALQQLEADGWQLCLSDLVVLEVKLKPYRQERYDLIAEYDLLFFETAIFSPFDSVFHDALEYAKTNGLKTMDAIHIAFAVNYKCELFVTTDQDFHTLKSLPLHMIDLSQAIP
jgi:predicted nucleic acid-binding protein